MTSYTSIYSVSWSRKGRAWAYVYIAASIVVISSEQVLICDALNLPYRDESFDAALSIAVIQ
jgi:hypothetical protein